MLKRRRRPPSPSELDEMLNPMSKLCLTKAEIFAAPAQSTPPVEVHVPEWGGSVFVREMTGRERDKFEADYDADKADLRARLLCACVCDEGGALLFDKAEDVARLTQKGIRAIQRVFKAALKLNAITAGDIDELEKK